MSAVILFCFVFLIVISPSLKPFHVSHSLWHSGNPSPFVATKGVNIFKNGFIK